MFFEKEAIIHHENGIHARVAAMIVQKSHELYQKHNCKIYLRSKNSQRVAMHSLMPLVALRITCGDSVFVAADNEKCELVVNEMVEFLEGDFTLQSPLDMREVDELLHENAFTAEQIFFSMANGLIVTNQDDIVSVCNPAAAKLLKMSEETIIGQNVCDVIPDTRLHIVSQTGRGELACRQKIGDAWTITNSTPIIIDGTVRGATAIFEDISAMEKIKWEFYEVKELQERLQLILESVQDGICVLNKAGNIVYVNPSYLRILKKSWESLVGKNIYDIAPQGARCAVLKTGVPQIGSISYKKDGTTIVANANPIIVDGEISGVVSVIKNITEIQTLMEKLTKVSEKAEYLEQELFRTRKIDSSFAGFIGCSGKIVDVLAMAAKAAKGTATVLIRGESGTGKELVAEGIHYASERAKGPFIRVNCGAIPSTLLESELFGHEKGAFTGALRRKLGKFELANHGTIFLDEIGEMDKNMQVKLLRALQQREFDRVGGEDTIKVDVRIIAATNRNLEQMMREDKFRDDLYYRLNVIPLFLPPLRERQEDIPLLCEYFINKISKISGKVIRGIQKTALEVLMDYKWPGNVRELENIIERVLTLMDSDYIYLEQLPSYITGAAVRSEVNKLAIDTVVLSWEEYEKQIIAKALKQCGSFNAAAKQLKLTHKTVAAKARKYDLV